MSKDIALSKLKDTQPLNDPNILQALASDPTHSSWVGASAGTGKTKVLTDRVLRLLLPRPDASGQTDHATDPSRILCLTFTKAAASEMAVRINKTLAQWAVMDDHKLDSELEKLMRTPSNKALRASARRLFGTVIDVPGGLKIMTIHAFCQSVLSRFPLESGLSPSFDILDDALAHTLVAKARDKILSEEHTSPPSPTQKALKALTAIQSEQQLNDMLARLNAERTQLLKILRDYPDDQELWDIIRDNFDVKNHHNAQDALQELCSFHIISKDDFHTLQSALSQGGKRDQSFAQDLGIWIELGQDQRLEKWSLLKNIFVLKTKNQPRSLSKKASEWRGDIPDLFVRAAQSILKAQDQYHAFQCAEATFHLLILGHAIQNEFARLKAFHGVLDYDDLIRLTRDLLKGEAANKGLRDPSAWVLFKLDGGLDHILVDEAQDTNAEQWDIISALCDDFFAGHTARSSDNTPHNRSIFVVGDEKQSIFSFQRADPDRFKDMRAFFQDKIEQSDQGFCPVQMNTSFRSAPAILDFVNCIFDHPNGRSALGLDPQTPIEHHAYRTQAPSRVDLWEMCQSHDAKPTQPWALPVNETGIEGPKSQLCRMIAEDIQQRLERDDVLESKNRAITPGDIMILLRQRKDYAPTLIRELKMRGVPVSGLDRMVLSQELVVEDMIALADFVLLPEDDLSLACVLRSPLINLSEQDIFAIAHNRQNTLWNALKASKHSEITHYLSQLMTQAGALRPYDFYASCLHKSCPADPEGSALRAIQKRLGQDVLDPLEEFLSAALNYETNNVPTMQGFIYAQRDNMTEIKRDQEEAKGEVRIMTVHGSKGLQAPIVYLPDTTLSYHARSKNRPNLIWPNRSGLSTPLWAPSKSWQSHIFKQACDNAEHYYDSEYQRLLYVALTRAEDQLIICGAEPKTQMLDHSWYAICQNAFDKMAQANHKAISSHTLQDGSKTKIAYRRYSQLEKPSPSKISSKNEIIRDIELPDWIYHSATPEPSPPRPLSPTRLMDDEQSAASPKKQALSDYRFQRGRLTHKLLEHLPDIPQHKWEHAARSFLTHARSDLSEDILDDIWTETRHILHHPEFADIFGPGSMAEVPISGLLEHKTLISGQIDRLLITDKCIFIIDYKTNRPPPQNPQDVQNIYIKQLRGYHDILQKIYPDRHIKCALIWTDGPILMDMTEHL